MIFEIKNIELFISITALLISILVFFNAKNVRKVAEKSLNIAENIKRKAEIEYLKTTPAIEMLEVLNVGDLNRVVLLLSNMRSTPFRINSLSVEKKVYKKRNMISYIKSKIDPDFNWDYDPVENYFWNPKGNLDNTEKYVSEAGEFLIVKENEKILVTIPDFNEHIKYKFEIKTTHGNVSLASTVRKNGKVCFCNEFRESFT